MIRIGENGSVSDGETLILNHNAGFFSCSTVCLRDIIHFLKKYRKGPILNRSNQYNLYKSVTSDISNSFFGNKTMNNIDIDGIEKLNLFLPSSVEDQFSDYTMMNFDILNILVDNYFSQSQQVKDMINFYENKYNIDYENTCGVFYRGNDKFKETTIASYSEFLEKANSIYEQNREIRFLVQPDETEFLEEFRLKFKNTFNVEETPHISKKNTAVFYEIPIEEREIYAIKFLAAVIVLSKCKFLITHSGNCGMWSVLYRGHCNNIFQFLNDKWIN